MRYALGVDLGRERDYTALVLIEERGEAERPAGGAARDKKHLLVRHVERLPLGLSYPVLAGHVKDVHCAAEQKLASPVACVVDRTGVGQAVSDMLLQMGVAHIPVTLTGGRSVRTASEGLSVPKAYIIRCLRRLVNAQRLRVAAATKDAGLLRHELNQFTTKISARTAHEPL
ncbi:MAG: hypothetical protein RhofKO_19600 [Rhodothermales bacterium]